MAPLKRARVPQDIVKQAMNDMQRDPQLPRSNPTEAFWQLPASALAKHQSTRLPEKTTYAIIGSGITGCSVATNLLENLPSDSKATLTVLEARALTSGATGRNGGHLLSPIPEEFCRLEQAFGRDETVKMAKFAERTLGTMYHLANGGGSELQKAAEVRKVRSVSAYYDKSVFEEAKKSRELCEELIPAFKDDLEVYTSDEGKEKFNVKNTIGVLTYSAGAFWPYRMITQIFARLLDQYEGRFSVETETPVLSVEYDNLDQAYPYLLATPRGTVRASTVIHCTNGWSGHLLPKLRGKIFPLRGTMSCQQAGTKLPHEGDQRSWSTLKQPSYNPEDQSFSYGLYYITQHATTGDVFIGGEEDKLPEIMSSDDTEMSPKSKSLLESVLPTIFQKGWTEDEKPVVRKIWSGIMGFTPDHLPWVGQIPKAVTERKGDGEWIAAGYNGYGMPLCWGCGEAVAKSILGKKAEVQEWLPESFLITLKRFNSPYSTPEAAIAALLDQHPSWTTIARLAFQHTIQSIYRAISRQSS